MNTRSAGRATSGAVRPCCGRRFGPARRGFGYGPRRGRRRLLAPQARKERGSGTLLVACSALALVGVAIVAMWVVAWFSCVQRASAVADLAAIGAAATKASGGDPCEAAGVIARRNDAVVSSCAVRGNDVHFDVTVVVAVALRPAVAGAPSMVTGTATAGTLS